MKYIFTLMVLVFSLGFGCGYDAGTSLSDRNQSNSDIGIYVGDANPNFAISYDNSTENKDSSTAKSQENSTSNQQDNKKKKPKNGIVRIQRSPLTVLPKSHSHGDPKTW